MRQSWVLSLVCILMPIAMDAADVSISVKGADAVFADSDIVPYATNRRFGDGLPAIVTGPRSIQQQPNSWSRVLLNGGAGYRVTPYTVLEFDLRVDVDGGEVYAIGFDTNDNFNASRSIFAIGGSQIWSQMVNDFHSDQNAASGIVHYRIPVGQFYSGVPSRLVFINDDDGEDDGEKASVVTWRNIRIYDVDVMTKSSEEIDLVWEHSDDADIAGYEIMRRIAGAATYTSIASLPADTTVYRDIGLAAETTYEYEVYVQRTWSTDLVGDCQSTTDALVEVPIVIDDVSYSIPLKSAGYIEGRSEFGQDLDYEVVQDDNGLQISGNTWKRIDLPAGYVVNQNTVLTCEVASSHLGDFVGLGLGLVDNNKSMHHEDWDNLKNIVFGIGTGYWGKVAADLSPDGQSVTVRMPIGQWFPGVTIDHLVFICDNDDTDAPANLSVRNLGITSAKMLVYANGAPVECDLLSVPGQDTWRGSGTISEDRNGLSMYGNAWKALEVNVLIESDTVLTFDYELIKEGEAHAIGFTNDLSVWPSVLFHLDGTHVAKGVFSQENIIDVHTLSFAIGQLLGSQSYRYLVLVNDHDVSGCDAQAIWSNIYIGSFEHANGVVDLAFEGGYVPSVTSRSEVGAHRYGYSRINGDNIDLIGMMRVDVPMEPYVVKSDSTLSFSYDTVVQGDFHGIRLLFGDGSTALYQLDGSLTGGSQDYRGQTDVEVDLGGYVGKSIVCLVPIQIGPVGLDAVESSFAGFALNDGIMGDG